MSSVKLLCRFSLRACAAALAAARDEADKCCATQRGIRFRRSQARTWPSRKMMSSKAWDGRPCLQMTFMPCSVADGDSCPALWACMASRATATAAAKAAAAAAAGATRLRKRCMLTYAQEAKSCNRPYFVAAKTPASTAGVIVGSCASGGGVCAPLHIHTYAAVGSDARGSGRRWTGRKVNRVSPGGLRN